MIKNHTCFSLMRKLIIIQNCHTQSRVIKRTKELIDAGIDVEVYGFRWEGSIEPSLPYPIKVLGTFKEHSFVDRFRVLLKSMRIIKREHPRKENSLFYVFSLDLMMVFHFIYPSAEYIYEESDLTHTYFGSKILRTFLEKLDKRLIRKSYKTVFTSEGFIRYHFGEETPNNAVLIPNKLDKKVLALSLPQQRKTEANHLVLGFVGVPRFKAVRDFIKVFCARFPQHEFHVFGGPIKQDIEAFEALQQYPNYHYHGAFKSPGDLPEIYGRLDAVLSTYDTEYINVRYAEPNKLYEAIYFETPIIASKGTFLADKIMKMGVGFEVDTTKESDIISFVNQLTVDAIEAKRSNCANIPKKSAVNDNTVFVKEVVNYLQS